jgi:putative tryptophan/tyrosine transport system substrate-binding protein
MSGWQCVRCVLQSGLCIGTVIDKTQRHPGAGMTSILTRRVLTALAAWAVLLAMAEGTWAAEPPDQVVRVGYLSLNPRLSVGAGRITDMLAKLGFVEGRNLVLEVRHASGNPALLAEAAAELVKLKVDVIYAVTSPAAFAAKNATRSIPIVVWAAHGAVETGLVPNLRRPGGNLTGTESLAAELDAKRIQLLKQIVPGLTRLAVLYDTADQGSPQHLQLIHAAGKPLGVTFSVLEVRRPEDFDPVFAAQPGQSLGAVLTLTSNMTFRQWPRIRDFALANRLPTLCEFRLMAESGCLLSYGPTFDEMTERNAIQIAKILRGTPPGELPIEQPTRFELAVNLKTARALGLVVPQEILLRADAVIE